MSRSLQVLHRILVFQDVVDLSGTLLLLLELAVLLPRLESMRNLVCLLLCCVCVQCAQIQVVRQLATIRVTRHVTSTVIIHLRRNEASRYALFARLRLPLRLRLLVDTRRRFIIVPVDLALLRVGHIRIVVIVPRLLRDLLVELHILRARRRRFRLSCVHMHRLLGNVVPLHGVGV